MTTSKSLWEINIKYSYDRGEGRFSHIAFFLDMQGRNIVEYHMGLLCKTEGIIIILKRGLKKRKLIARKPTWS